MTDKEIKEFLLNNFEQQLKENDGMAILNSKEWSELGYSNKEDIGKSNIFSEIFDDFDLSNLRIPEGITSINEGAFGNCISLTSITIPNSVTSIGTNAFNGCSSLISIEIPNSVTSIQEYAFSYCTSLTSITIPDDITSICQGVFINCSSLANITIPNTITCIGLAAFYECISLTSIDYQGTKEQGEKIKKGFNWKDGSNLKIIHCTDGIIRL